MNFTPDERFARFREYVVVKGLARPDAMLGISTFRTLTTKADETGGNRDYVVIATTPDIDGEMEVVVPSGIDAAHFMQNKSVFLDHRYGTEYCVGKMRRFSPYPSKADFRGYALRVHLFDEPVPNAILARARDGMGPGASIGFEAIDRGAPTEEEAKRYTVNGVRPRSIVRRCRLLEVSLTDFPCNVACQGLPTPEAKRMLGGLVERQLMTPESAKAMGWDETPRRRVVLLGDVVSVRRNLG